MKGLLFWYKNKKLTNITLHGWSNSYFNRKVKWYLYSRRVTLCLHSRERMLCWHMYYVFLFYYF